MKKTLMQLDWASLSYHKWFSMVSKKNTAISMAMDTSEEELVIFKQLMLNTVLELIQQFNPMDIYLSSEGSDIWRKKYVEQYYNENTKVYYDSTGYYIVVDNLIYILTMNENKEIQVDKTSVKKANEVKKGVKGLKLPEKFMLLEKAPEKIKKFVWDKDNKIMPSYKGTRDKDFWPFLTPYKVWRDYKETFATEIAPLFRGYVVGIPEAEGDDCIYTTITHLSDKYDDVILVSGDSDMNQMLTNPKIKIFNHKTREFVVSDNPVREREIKILSGDTSDNIKGMGLASNALRLGESGAIALFDSVGNIYETAKQEGWLNQYTKNQTLINLDFIPADIQRKIKENIDSLNPVLKSLEEVGTYTSAVQDKINQMKDLGFYSLLTKEYVLANPNIFKGNLFNTNSKYSSENSNVKFSKGKDDFTNLDSEDSLDFLLESTDSI